MADKITELTDNALLDLINNELRCIAPEQFYDKMGILTRFVDGFYVQNKEFVMYKMPDKLTTLDVRYFDYENLEEALIFSYVIGIENSVVLFQEFPVQEGTIRFEDLPDKQADAELAKQKPAGFIVVVKNNIDKTYEEIINNSQQANIQDVLDMQDKRWNNMHLHEKTKRNTDFRLQYNQAIYERFKPKPDWHMAEELMPISTKRDNVLFSSHSEEGEAFRLGVQTPIES